MFGPDFAVDLGATLLPFPLLANLDDVAGLPRREVDMNGARSAPAVQPDLAAAHVGVLGAVAAGWGVFGLAAGMAFTIRHFLAVGIPALTSRDVARWQWALTASTVLDFAYYLGYRTLQRRCSLLVVARASYLARNPRLSHALLAPLFCFGVTHASWRRARRSAFIAAAIGGVAFAVRLLPAPYDGIVSVGAGVGLAWGGASLLAVAVRASAGRVPHFALELPLARDGAATSRCRPHH